MSPFSACKRKRAQISYSETNEALFKDSSKILMVLSLTYLILQILEVTLNPQDFHSEWRQKCVTMVIFSCGGLVFGGLNIPQCLKTLNRLFQTLTYWKVLLIQTTSGVYVLLFVIFELRSATFSDLTKTPEITKGINFALFLVTIINVAQGWVFKSILIAIPTLLVGLTTATKVPGELSTGFASIPILFLMVALYYFEGRRLKVEQKQQNCKESEFWKSLINKISEGVLVLDEHYKATYINDACKKILKRHGNGASSNDEEINIDHLNPFGGIKLIESTNFQDKPNFQEQSSFTVAGFIKEVYQRVKNAGSERLKEESHKKPESHIMTLEAHAQSFDLGKIHYQIQIFAVHLEGKLLFLLTLSDITADKSVLELKMKSENNSKALASVTHELRTPLNGSINFLEVALEDDRIPTDIKTKALLPAKRSNLLLLNLVNDILDFSRIKAEKINLNIEKKNLIETLREAVELFELQAKRKNIRISLIPKDMDTELDFATDHQRLKQIVLNLLSNSVKFTQQGSVSLTIESFSLNAGPQQTRDRVLKICVSDTGVGMTEVDQSHLFQDYSQVGGENQRQRLNPNGIGLGLSIANALARLLGPVRSVDNSLPAIKVESKVNEGSLFYFLIEEKRLLIVDCDQSHVADSIIGSPNRSHETSFSSPRHSEESPMLNSTHLRPSQFLRMYSNPQKNPHQGTIKAENKAPRNKATVGLEGEIARINKYYFSMGPIFPSQKKIFLKQLATEGQIIELSQQAEKTCKCVRILVVDDDSFNLIASEMVFCSLKLPIDTAFDGKDAIEKILSKNSKIKSSSCRVCGDLYSVIFMDINMPVMDGYSAAKELKKMMNDDIIHKLPIVACSAISQDISVLSDFDEECTKPFAKDKLMEILKKYDFHIKQPPL